MKGKINETMQNLMNMFQNFDEDTIYSILVLNKGAIQPTIEDLLKLTNEHDDENDCNMFADDSQKKTKMTQKTQSMPNYYDQNEDLVRKTQESEDLKMALALQQQYEYEEENNDPNVYSNSNPYHNQQQQQQQQQQQKQMNVNSSLNQGRKADTQLKNPPAKSINDKDLGTDEYLEIIEFHWSKSDDPALFTINIYDEKLDSANSHLNVNKKFEEIRLVSIDDNSKVNNDNAKKKNFISRFFSKTEK